MIRAEIFMPRRFASGRVDLSARIAFAFGRKSCGKTCSFIVISCFIAK